LPFVSLERDPGVVACARNLVVLRRPVADDADDWVALRKANWTYLRRAEPTPRERDPNSHDAFARLLDSCDTDRSARFLLRLADSDEVVGQISLSEISRGAFQSCYIGYWVGRRYAGRGLMSDGLRQAVAFAFQTLELHRVEANIAPANKASRAVAARCGFRLEGRARGLLHIDGRWRDHERWAVLNARYPAGR
jgi:ribosomal-protein-alanine N-acetyltransferase